MYAYRYCSPSRGSFLSGRLPFHAHEANPGITVHGCLNLNYTLLPAKLPGGGALTLLPLSYGFVVLPQAQAAACK